MRTHVEIGEKVVERLHIDKGLSIKLEGTVVWIHPKKRFYRVEFITPKGFKLHESYQLYRRSAI